MENGFFGRSSDGPRPVPGRKRRRPVKWDSEPIEMPDHQQIERLEGDRDERIYRLPVRVFENLYANCYLVVDGDYQALIDTGSNLPYATRGLAEALEALRHTWGEDVRLSRIVLTHGHIDHYGGLDALRRLTDAPVAIHGLDRRAVEDPLGHHEAQEGALRKFFRRAGLEGDEAKAALELYHGEASDVEGGPIAT
ncbi:MAG TPA: MBL fold metallo-hydrolase, partial [Oscillatoriaceae cyanobacterium]